MILCVIWSVFCYLSVLCVLMCVVYQMAAAVPTIAESMAWMNRQGQTRVESLGDLLCQDCECVPCQCQARLIRKFIESKIPGHPAKEECKDIMCPVCEMRLQRFLAAAAADAERTANVGKPESGYTVEYDIWNFNPDTKKHDLLGVKPDTADDDEKKSPEQPPGGPSLPAVPVSPSIQPHYDPPPVPPPAKRAPNFEPCTEAYAAAINRLPLGATFDQVKSFARGLQIEIEGKPPHTKDLLDGFGLSLSKPVVVNSRKQMEKWLEDNSMDRIGFTVCYPGDVLHWIVGVLVTADYKAYHRDNKERRVLNVYFRRSKEMAEEDAKDPKRNTGAHEGKILPSWWRSPLPDMCFNQDCCKKGDPVNGVVLDDCVCGEAAYCTPACRDADHDIHRRTCPWLHKDATVKVLRDMYTNYRDDIRVRREKERMIFVFEAHARNQAKLREAADEEKRIEMEGRQAEEKHTKFLRDKKRAKKKALEAKKKVAAGVESKSPDPPVNGTSLARLRSEQIDTERKAEVKAIIGTLDLPAGTIDKATMPAIVDMVKKMEKLDVKDAKPPTVPSTPPPAPKKSSAIPDKPPTGALDPDFHDHFAQRLATEALPACKRWSEELKTATQERRIVILTAYAKMRTRKDIAAGTYVPPTKKAVAPAKKHVHVNLVHVLDLKQAGEYLKANGHVPRQQSNRRLQPNGTSLADMMFIAKNPGEKDNDRARMTFVFDPKHTGKPYSKCVTCGVLADIATIDLSPEELKNEAEIAEDFAAVDKKEEKEKAIKRSWPAHLKTLQDVNQHVPGFKPSNPICVKDVAEIHQWVKEMNGVVLNYKNVDKNDPTFFEVTRSVSMTDLTPRKNWFKITDAPATPVDSI
jgi:hypothetical protein